MPAVMESWAELLLRRRTMSSDLSSPLDVYTKGYKDGVSDTMAIVGVALAVMWFCVMAGFPALHMPLRKYVKPWLARYVRSGQKTVVWVQQLHGESRLMDLFHGVLATMCGVEFYIAVLPTLFWIGEPRLARSMTIFCAAMTYMGNAMKDTFCSPRPSSPPVRRPHTDVRLQGDTRHATSEEYGFPSTHTINGICFSGYLIHFFNRQAYFTDGDYFQPTWWSDSWLPPSVLLSIVLWCGNICYGRLYLGMHTPVDILGGTVMGLLMLTFWVIVEDFCDAWVTAGFVLLPLYQLCYSIMILWAYPVPERQNPSFSYSLYLTAACNGVVFGLWRTYPGLHSDEWALELAAARGPLMTSYGLLWTARRFLVGLAIVLAARAVAKEIAKPLLQAGARKLKLNARFEDKNGNIPQRMLNLSNGYRFVAYGAVGWAATDPAFALFELLGI